MSVIVRGVGSQGGGGAAPVSGRYLPVTTPGANIASVAPGGTAEYQQVGDWLTVRGVVLVDPVTTGILTTFTMSLPPGYSYDASLAFDMVIGGAWVVANATATWAVVAPGGVGATTVFFEQFAPSAAARIYAFMFQVTLT